MIYVPLGITPGRDVNFEISPKRLCFGVKGAAPVVDGELENAVHLDDSYWVQIAICVDTSIGIADGAPNSWV